MEKVTKEQIIGRFIFATILIALCVCPSFIQAQEFSTAQRIHRINAHGDEFNTIALSPDEKRLAIGTEKGELIIWDIPGDKVEKRLTAEGAIHQLAFLGDNQTVITAGGPHDEGNEKGSLRKWNIATGAFESWSNCGEKSLMSLSVDSQQNTVAAASLDGYVAVWNGATGKVIASWSTDRLTAGLALVDGRLLINQAKNSVKELLRKGDNEDDETEANEDDDDDADSISTGVYAYSLKDLKQPATVFLKAEPDRGFSGLLLSPDRRWVALKALVDSEYRVVIADAKTGADIASFSGLTAAWRADGKLQLFDSGEPTDVITISSAGGTVLEKDREGSEWHSAGSPAQMSGQVASRDGRRAWLTFAIGGVLLECDLEADKGRDLLSSSSLAYALDARVTGANGYLVTGGDDRSVRVWNLNGLSPVREFKVANGVPQGVAVLADGKRMVFSSSSKDAPSDIFVADLVTGQTTKLLAPAQPFVKVRTANDGFLYDLGNKIILASANDGSSMREFEFAEGVDAFNTSANARWLATADEKGSLWLIDLRNGQRSKWTGGKIEDLKQIVVSNDGRYVFTTEWKAVIRRWDTQKQESIELATHRGQAACLSLSADERFVIVGGNHYDIGVYDTKTGETAFYTRVDGADFYVTNAWMNGQRLIFTTDGGLMFELQLQK